AAPGGENDLRITSHDLVRLDATSGGAGLVTQIGEDVPPSRDLDHLGNPADAHHQGIEPLLEVDAGTVGPHAGGLADLLDLVAHVLHEAACRRLRAEGATDHQHRPQHVVERALVGAQHTHPRRHQIAHDVPL